MANVTSSTQVRAWIGPGVAVSGGYGFPDRRNVRITWVAHQAEHSELGMFEANGYPGP